MPRLTAAQHRDRRSYLGATDIAAIAGVNPWRKPIDVYLEKIGELDPEARATKSELDRWERGHRLEDVALEWDAEIRGHAFERIHRDVAHPRLPFVVVHPDARVKPWRSTRRVLEAKTSARAWDEIPRYVEAQVQMQMAALGADVADVVVLGFDGPPKPYELPRNDELIVELEKLAAEFWQRVEAREAPPLEDSRLASRWLDRMFREGPEIEADAEQADALQRLLTIRNDIERLEHEDRSLVNALKFSMAGSSRLYAPGVGKVVWTAPGDRRTVAWREVAAAYRALLDDVVAGRTSVDELRDADLSVFESLHERIESGIRQFRVTPAKARQEVSAA